MSENSLSELAVYGARPTVRVNDRDDERLRHLLLAMEMHEHEDGLSRLELRLSNVASAPDGSADLAFEDEQSVKLGDPIAVYSGDAATPREIFRGVVTGLEAVFPEFEPPELTVLAEDNLQKARFARRTKTYPDATLADIAQEIASRAGLTPKITGLTENVGTQVQLNESDLAFLRRLLARQDGDVQVVGNELHVSPRADVRRGAIDLELHSQLRRVTVLADLSHQVSEVQVTGWNAERGSTVAGTSRGVSPGPGAGRGGPQLAEQAFGSRPHRLSHLAVASDAEARALADAAFEERRRRFVSVEGTSEGNPSLRVGTHVTLKGVGARFNNTYYVTRCCHHFDLTHGYQTDFLAESAFLGRP